ncbi:tetratricopeptide repeat protein [Longimicrobium sp.]|uniref:tetratricopeptide repeat protein n=1 Tax=Longimicrobium sp. TaxID=2029185 RepID=UPI002E352B2F|nr:tetratricopeptide repeat protein [Longimicrobium sp.]HEX6040975.1 tetratricopeptide repeat protein [Longimicrobium sp.]
MIRPIAILGLALLIGGGALAEGDRAFRRGDYARAADAYRRALADGDSSATVRYNLGTALLRLNRHEEARPHLEAAARLRGRADLPVRAEYNAGNADLAPVAAGRVPQAQRRERLLRAIGHYRRALMRNPGDADAKWNLELAQRLLRQQGGGGGGDEDEKDSPQGGGGEGPPSPASPQPKPGQASSGGNQPMTPERAERILAGAEAREQQIQRQQLKRDQARISGIRDW